MRSFFGKCKELPEIVMAEGSMKMKKVKISTSKASPYNVYQLKSRRRSIPTKVTDNSASSSATSSQCTEFPEYSSCLSIVNLEVEETEAMTSTNFHNFNRAVEDLASFSQESNGYNSPAGKMSSTKSTVEMKMPSDDELEDFFSAAEKDLHRRFFDKYNFNIVKDMPVEGRYEWVEIKP